MQAPVDVESVMEFVRTVLHLDSHIADTQVFALFHSKMQQSRLALEHDESVWLNWCANAVCRDMGIVYRFEPTSLDHIADAYVSQ
jgi:hypothetical protein